MIFELIPLYRQKTAFAAIKDHCHCNTPYSLSDSSNIGPMLTYPANHELQIVMYLVYWMVLRT